MESIKLDLGLSDQALGFLAGFLQSANQPINPVSHTGALDVIDMSTDYQDHVTILIPPCVQRVV